MRKQHIHAVQLVFAVILQGVLLVGGCAASVTPAAHHRGAGSLSINPSAVTDWPKRYPEPLRDMLEQETEPDDSASLPFGAEPMHAGMLRLFRAKADEAPERARRIYGNGVIHAFDGADDGTIRLKYVTNRLPPKEFAALAAEDAMLDDPRAENVLRWHLLVRPSLAEEERGLIVHLPSIGNRKYENAVNKAFRKRGWSVLTVIPPGLTIRVIESGAAVSPPVVTTGETLASRLDDFAADYAYAVEGAISYLRTWHESLRTRPIVVVGYSAGTLPASTVAARLGDDVEAAIFVGGGANVAGILMESTAAKLGVRLRMRHGAKVENQLAELPQAYLQASRFDPYHTAQGLSTRPVLVIDGSFDQIIPRDYRELLYQRLDRPERWTYPLGHVLLFWLLPSQAESIATWLDEALATRHNATLDE